MAQKPGSDMDVAELDALLNSTSGLEMLDGILDASVSSGILANAKGVDLAALLADSEQAVSAAEEEFIEAHCKQLDELCRLYTEVTQCESRLQDFERDISRFQGTLTATAEDIVNMQSRTVDLCRRIDNRKNISQRLQRVYEALNECEDFCEKISAATVVDAKFLQWIRELESHIAFLADNPELEDSKINETFNPKLQAAALRAGDKLHKYLLKRLAMLTDENSNVALIQQAIERQGQYAFAFLLRYNNPIADDILKQYIKMMSDVYLKQTKPIGKQVFEIVSAKGSKATTEVETFVSAEILTQLGGVRRQASEQPPGNGVGGARGSTPGASVHRPTSRSISLSLGHAIDKFRGKVPDRRDATFVDNVLALQSINTSYRLVTMDPTVTIKLDATTSWVHRFSEMYCRLVNNVINEGRFIDHFFFSAGTTEQEETLLHLILDRSLEAATQIIVAEIPGITDLLGVLCAKRALELFKNFVTQSADPLPIMIMASLFDQIGSALSTRLEELLVKCSSSLDDVSFIIAFKPHPPLSERAKELPFSEVVSHDAVLAAQLNPHDLTVRYADVTCRMHLLNTLLLEGSRVGGGFDRIFFDDSMSHHLTQSNKTVVGIIQKLAHRHSNPTAAAVFEVNNIGHIVMAMAFAESTYMPTIVAEVTQQSTHGEGEGDAEHAGTPRRLDRPPASPTTRRQASMSMPPRSPDHASATGTGVSELPAASGGFGVTSVLTNVPGTSQYAWLLGELRRSVATYIALDLQASRTTAGVYEVVEWALKELDDDFFAQPSVAEGAATAPALESLPVSAPSEEKLLDAVSTFHREWQAAMHKTSEGVKVLFPERGGELASFVLREYVAALLTVNTRLKTVVERCFPKAQAVKSKLIGNLAFSHEVARYIHTKQSSAA